MSDSAHNTLTRIRIRIRGMITPTTRLALQFRLETSIMDEGKFGQKTTSELVQLAEIGDALLMPLHPRMMETDR